MIGPSSSHTAGAARLAKVSKIIAKHDFDEVTFRLFGSFASTYIGHGTDKALVAGVLGFDPSDENLPNSFIIAKERGIKYNFIPEEDEEFHPNTAEIIFHLKNGNLFKVKGASLGGGRILISEVDGEEISFSGDFPTLIVNHFDSPGAISSLTNILYKNEINIATMRVFRHKKGKDATMIIELDEILPDTIINEIRQNAIIKSLRYISPV